MRAIAILAAYNEERYIGACLEHYASQGVEVYLIDNSSTDRTVQIAEEYRDRNLVGIENAPREGGFHRWSRILEFKEDLARSLEADWFIHTDPDEMRLPPSSDRTLAEALADVDAQGYNAVNFLEFTFVPTREEPDHDHPDFQKTMRSYYPFSKNFPYRVNAWKRQSKRVDLVESGGHRVKFPDQYLYPQSFKMRHYQFLSLLHSRQKYLENKKYPPEEIERGMHGWRARMDEEKFRLPSQEDLSVYISDDELSVANPRMEHVITDWSRPRREDGDEKLLPTATDLIGSGSRLSKKDMPVIFGGFPESGTPLMRRVLDVHPRIHCSPEDLHRRESFVDTARQIVPEFQVFRFFGRAYVNIHNQTAALQDKPRWADGSPANVMNWRGWQTLLGESWLFVHLVRNPLDALASIKESGLGVEVPPGLNDRIELYRRYNRAGFTFGNTHPSRYYRLSYERLIENPEQTLSGLMNWLGEELEPSQLDPVVENSRNDVHWKEVLTTEEADKISRKLKSIWGKVSEPGDARILEEAVRKPGT